MKKTKILFWTFTLLFVTGMMFSTIPYIMETKDTVDIVSGYLGYPQYIIRFIGIAKLLGIITLVIPGFNRLKEWAYAGFVIDIIGAIYSGLSVGSGIVVWIPVIIISGVLWGGSYFYHHKLLKLSHSHA